MKILKTVKKFVFSTNWKKRRKDLKTTSCVIGVFSAAIQGIICAGDAYENCQK